MLLKFNATFLVISRMELCSLTVEMIYRICIQLNLF